MSTPYVPDPARPGGSAYLEVKARLAVVTGDGVVDPRRLHGPDLARWQVTEARSARRPEVQRWLDAAGATPPDCA